MVRSLVFYSILNYFQEKSKAERGGQILVIDRTLKLDRFLKNAKIKYRPFYSTVYLTHAHQNSTSWPLQVKLKKNDFSVKRKK